MIIQNGNSSEAPRPITNIDDVLSRIGLGKYQIIIYALIGIYFVCDGAEAIALSVLNITLEDVWGIDESQISLIGSGVFLGIFIGSLVSGIFGDKFGRRPIFIGAVFLVFVIGTISAFSPSYYFFLFTRTIFGCAVGLLGPTVATIITEVTPAHVRARMMVIAIGLFTIGELMACVVAYFVMGDPKSGNWRLMLMWVTIPSLISFLFSFKYMRESPRFALFQNYDKGMDVLNHMHVTNKKVPLEIDPEEKSNLQEYLRRQKESKSLDKGVLIALLSGENFRITLLTWVMWFVLSFVYYGIIFIMPSVLANMNSSSDNNENFFLLVFIPILGEIPSYVIGYMMVEHASFGRKNSLIVCFMCCAFFCMFCMVVEGEAYFLTFMFLAKMFISTAFSIIYAFTSEIYHTKYRTTGIGMASGASRIGGIIMPWVSIYSFKISPAAPFVIFSVACMIAALAGFMLPYDTMGRELDKLEKSSQQENENELDTA